MTQPKIIFQHRFILNNYLKKTIFIQNCGNSFNWKQILNTWNHHRFLRLSLQISLNPDSYLSSVWIYVRLESMSSHSGDILTWWSSSIRSTLPKCEDFGPFCFLFPHSFSVLDIASYSWLCINSCWSDVSINWLSDGRSHASSDHVLVWVKKRV